MERPGRHEAEVTLRPPRGARACDTAVGLKKKKEQFFTILFTYSF